MQDWDVPLHWEPIEVGVIRYINMGAAEAGQLEQDESDEPPICAEVCVPWVGKVGA